MSATKIQNTHCERIAYVYVRQSTPWQVIENRESTEMELWRCMFQRSRMVHGVAGISTHMPENQSGEEAVFAGQLRKWMRIGRAPRGQCVI